MTIPPNFRKGTGRLATDRYDFEAHLEGRNPDAGSSYVHSFRHKASQVDVDNPSLVYGSPTDVEEALENIKGFIDIFSSIGQGFVTIGDGYNTWHNANGNINYDPAIKSIDGILNAISTYLYSGVGGLTAYDRIKFGGILLIKAGTYIVKDTINIPPGLVLLGEGYGTKFVNATGLILPTISSNPIAVRQSLSIADGNITATSPVQITYSLVDAPIVTGDKVVVSDYSGIAITGGSGANGNVFTVTEVVPNTSFTLNGSTGVGVSVGGTVSFARPMFNVLPQIFPDVLRSVDDEAVDANDKFMFAKSSKIVNLTISDNFVENTILGDFNHYSPQNKTTENPLIKQSAGSNLELLNVYMLGRVEFSVAPVINAATSHAIKLDPTLGTGTILKITDCFIDGFSQPIRFDSIGGKKDFLQIDNSKIRAHGYLGIPEASSPAAIFGADLIHSWDSYNGTIWTDSIAGLNGAVDAGGLPSVGTQNGHTYPVFVDANNDGLITASSTMLSGLDSWTFYYAFKGLNFYNAVITKAFQFFLEYTGGFVTPKAAYYNYSGGTDLLGTTTVMNDNQWHRVIITANANSGALYVDGVLEASGTVATMPAAVNNPIYLGKPPTGGSIDGGILTIGVATRGMSAHEVSLLDTYISEYIVPPVTTQEANCIVHMNDNNAIISNNQFYGNHADLYTICYVKDRVATPAAYNTSTISIINNNFTGGTDALLSDSIAVQIDAAIISTPSAFSDNAKVIAYGNNYNIANTTFKVNIDAVDVINATKNAATITAPTTTITATTLAHVVAGQIEETAANNMLLTATAGNIVSTAGTNITETAVGDISETAGGGIGMSAAAGVVVSANGNAAFTNSIIVIAENDISVESTAGGYRLVTVQDIDLSSSSSTITTTSTTSTGINAGTSIGITAQTDVTIYGDNDVNIQAYTGSITLNGGISTAGIANVTTATYTITEPNYILLVATSTIAAVCDITLPSPSLLGKRIIIKDKQGVAGTYNIILHPYGAELIDGVTGSSGTPADGIILSANWGVWEFVADGTNWFKL